MNALHEIPSLKFITSNAKRFQFGVTSKTLGEEFLTIDFDLIEPLICIICPHHTKEVFDEFNTKYADCLNYENPEHSGIINQEQKHLIYISYDIEDKLNHV